MRVLSDPWTAASTGTSALMALDQLRKLTTGRVDGEANLEKAKEYRVRLRVVA
jgi:hypothetical protein